jgi:hypothetical protein
MGETLLQSYPPTVTLSMFMRQALEADGSCQKAVNGWAAQRAADGLSACGVRTGGYCRARQRLPREMVSTLTRQAGRLLSQKALAWACGQAGGRHRAVDARYPGEPGVLQVGARVSAGHRVGEQPIAPFMDIRA